MPPTEEQTARIMKLQDQLFASCDCGRCKWVRAQIAAIQAEGADGAGMGSEEMMPLSPK